MGKVLAWIARVKKRRSWMRVLGGALDSVGHMDTRETSDRSFWEESGAGHTASHFKCAGTADMRYEALSQLGQDEPASG